MRALTGEVTGPKDKQQALFRACLRQQKLQSLHKLTRKPGFKILLPLPCCVVKIDPHEKTRENGRFREISPVFSSLLFFEKIPIHFAIFSDRKDPNPRKRDFQKSETELNSRKDLNTRHGSNPFGFFVVFTECLQIVDYKINPSELGEDLNPRCAQKQKLQNNSISPPVGFEPTKAQNLFVISLFSGLSGIGVVLCVVTGGDENEKNDR